ncbi:hypothetical protein FJZ19_00725 [Candidatus Pacearchaeota archaeon]|nr:hypothetical protein [Candidatus Pacearchaeota archaeon]
MIFMGATYQSDSPYFEDKLIKARNKLKEFPTIASVVDNFNLANRENHTENIILNLLSAAVSDAFLENKPNERCNQTLKLIELSLKELLDKLSRSKKNNLIVKLKSFGDSHRDTINEIDFLIELKQNSNVSDIEYENETLGNHDFNVYIGGEEFNIEQTCLGRGKIQKMVERAFNIASKEIIERIPKRIFLKIDVDTDRILKERDNSFHEIKTLLMKDYDNLEKMLLIDLNGGCRIDNNLGSSNQSLYEIKDLYDDYDEFGQRLKKLLDSREGVDYLKSKKVFELTKCSITHFIIGPGKFGSVSIHSQCIWPSRAESLRKGSLINQLKRKIKEKIEGRQLEGKTNPIIAVRFEDFIFMNYSSEDDVWWEENFNELKNIIEGVFRDINNKEILGVLLYENTIKKSRFVKNPNIKVRENIIDKIGLLKNESTTT